MRVAYEERNAYVEVQVREEKLCPRSLAGQKQPVQFESVAEYQQRKPTWRPGGSLEGNSVIGVSMAS